MLIFRVSFRIPILSLAFVVQPFEPWDQGQSVVSPVAYRVDRTLPAKRKGFAPGALGKGEETWV